MNSISTLSIELTSRCNKTAKSGLFKSCHMCGRRQLEKQNPDYEKTLGDMDFSVFTKILSSIRRGMVVQLHWNGEPTLYPRLWEAAMLLNRRDALVCADTNGMLLRDRADSLAMFDSITVSVIEGDSTENYDRQICQMAEFMAYRENWIEKPKVNIRALGKIPIYFETFAKTRGIDIISRVFHAPEMSRKYVKPVTKPEIGVCLDLLHHPAVDRHGNVFPCVRFNPEGVNLLGNVKDNCLSDILHCNHRAWMIHEHFSGRRNGVPLCNECDYWGVPRGE